MTVLLTVSGCLMFLGLLVIVGMLLWNSASLVTVGIGMIVGMTMLGSGAVMMAVWVVSFIVGILRR